MKLATAVEKSANSKLGKVSATYASQESCPTSCPLFNNGCYAESGHTSFTTNRLNKAGSATPLEVAKQEAEAIGKLTGKLPLRLHVVGDCSTNEAAKRVSTAAMAHEAKHLKPVWTYTHAWDKVDRDSWGTVSVIASVDRKEDIEKARAKGYATAIVVDQHEQDSLKDGILPCPNQTKGVSCEECRLCMDDTRLREANITIGFAAHGVKKGKIIERLNTNV